VGVFFGAPVNAGFGDGLLLILGCEEVVAGPGHFKAFLEAFLGRLHPHRHGAPPIESLLSQLLEGAFERAGDLRLSLVLHELRVLELGDQEVEEGLPIEGEVLLLAHQALLCLLDVLVLVVFVVHILLELLQVEEHLPLVAKVLLHILPGAIEQC